MYILYPVAYPVAKLLDHLLGASNGLFFDRAGLKTLIMLHECMNFSTERLNKEEVTVITSMLDLNSRSVSSIMTPFSKVFTLSSDQILDEVTRYNILSSGYSHVPVLIERHSASFIGALSVKSLVALKSVLEVTVGQLSLETMPVVNANASVQELVHMFRNRTVDIVLVTENGSTQGEPLGIVTARDLMDELLGE